MRVSSICAATAMLAASSSVYGRITGMSVQQNGPLKQGDKFDVTFATEDYISNNEQYYVLFGLHEGQTYDKTLGGPTFAHRDIVKIDTNKLGNFTLTLTAPSISGTMKHANLTAAILDQTGASGGVSIDFYRSVVKVVKSS